MCAGEEAQQSSGTSQGGGERKPVQVPGPDFFPPCPTLGKENPNETLKLEKTLNSHVLISVHHAQQRGTETLKKP
jgi:hypothetical protein